MIVNDMEQQLTGAEAGAKTPTFMEEEIKRLKGRLEEKMAGPHARAHWEEMVEDCEIILNHFESKTPKASQVNDLRVFL